MVELKQLRTTKVVMTTIVTEVVIPDLPVQRKGEKAIVSKPNVQGGQNTILVKLPVSTVMDLMILNLKMVKENVASLSHKFGID